MIKIFRVVQQGDSFTVQSQKAEGGMTAKCNIVLQEFGGKFENQYAGVMLGNLALNKFVQGDLVVAALPVNSVTALVGAPVIVSVLFRRRQSED